MVKHQYKAMFASIVVGLIWVGVYHFLADSWFFSRLSLLLAIISFVPAGLVVLVHGRELGRFMWWDRSNVVLTTRRGVGKNLASFLRGHLLSSTSRSYNGCVGRASCRYNFANCSISSAVIASGCFSTNHVTFSLHGGVVSDPENVK